MLLQATKQAICDSLIAKVEVFSCPATVVSLRRYDEQKQKGARRTVAETRS